MPKKRPKMICKEDDRYEDAEVGFETMSSASSSDMEADVQIVNLSDTFSMNSVNSIEDLVFSNVSFITMGVR